MSGPAPPGLRPWRPAITAAVIVLAFSGCRSVVVSPDGEALGGGPPLGQAPWLALPGPGWVLVVPESGNATVMLFEPSLAAERSARSALILINHIRPVQRFGGRPVRSELARIEADCDEASYRLVERRLHQNHGGTGEPLGAVLADPLAPLRPVQPGTLAEDVLAALCRPNTEPSTPGA